MKIIISILVCIQLWSPAEAQPLSTKSPILYGSFHPDSLKAEPYGSWFHKVYQDYKPDSLTMAGLKEQSFRNVQIEVFLGTWCGDSKREVPRLLKLLDGINFPAANLHLIGLGGTDSLYKQSPGREEMGKGIFRVPVIVISRKGRELNRINEYPAFSLEKDLLKILKNEPLAPNYRSFATVTQWIADGTLVDPNISARSLAVQIRSLVTGENELNSLGYLLLNHQQKKEALKLFQVNSILFPESANISSSLGEGYLENGEYSLAVNLLEKSLEQNKDAKAVKGILSILYKAREKAIQ